MEQWVSDGRDIIRNRGLSLIPAGVEDQGFTIDLSDGLRGLLKRVTPHPTPSPKRTAVTQDMTGSAQQQLHTDPNANSATIDVPPQPPAKEFPVQYAECEIRYCYKDVTGNIVDVHCDIPMKKRSHGDPEGDDVIPTSSLVVSKDEIVDRDALLALMSTTSLDVVAGAGQVTQGMDEAIMQTSRGETTEWWLDPAFAFRENGFRSKLGSILADAPVYLQLTMVDFVNPMSSYERLQRGEELKGEANKKFGEYNQAVASSGGKQDCNHELFKEALRTYHRALTTIRKRYSFIPKPASTSSGEVAAAKADEASSSRDDNLNAVGSEPSAEEQQRLDTSLRSILLNNLAAMHYTVGNYSLAEGFVTRALQVAPRYDKALFRKALLLIHHQHNFDNAIGLLKQMIEDKIGDPAALESKIVEARVLQREYEAKSRVNAMSMMKGLTGTM